MGDSLFKIPKLSGSKNYEIWSIRIEAYLIKEGCLDVMTTDITSLTQEEQLLLQENASKAISIIKLSLEDGPLVQTRFITNPYLLWQKLKQLYEPKGFSSEFILSKDLINTTLSSQKYNLEEYINTFKRLVNNLEAKSIQLPKKFLVALLLNNLNSREYEYIIAVITQSIRINSEEELDLDSIIGQLLDEYRRLHSIRKGHSTASYSAPKSNNNNSRAEENKDIEMSMPTRKIQDISCDYCKKKGHTINKCWLKNPKLRPKVEPKKNSQKESSNSTLKEKETILATTVPNKSNIDFILDSGASVHTCCNKELFSSLDTTNTFITWGKSGNSISARGVGKIKLLFTETGQEVTLTNVLYVPELRVNLISLNKIINLGFKINFTRLGCEVISPSRNLILMKGYYKEGVTVFNAISNKDKTSEKINNISPRDDDNNSRENLEEVITLKPIE
jgi:hypothetical protein